MATTNVTGIVAGEDSDVHDEPHVGGSRITVRFIQRRVEELGLQPAEVAEQYDLDVADVYAALSYYHNNPDEMRRVEKRRSELADVAAEESSLTPPDS
jgi:uncharacterized protein (DUF433 family)